MMTMVLKRLNRESDERGFTLTEVIVAVLIFSILAAIAIPIYMNQQQTAMEQQIKAALTNASIILKQERTGANGRYPALLPADVIIPNDVSMAYTHSQNQDAYCLEASYGNGSEDVKLFLNGDNAGDTTISESDCTYTGTGPASTVLAGDVTAEDEPLLSWTAVEGAESYIVSNVTTGEVFTVSGQTSWTGNAMETTNSFRVTVKSGGEESDPSNTVQLSPAQVKPTAVPVLTINNISGNKSQRTGTLQWNPVKWTEEYVIYDASTNTELWSGKAFTLDISAKIGETLRVYLVAKNDTGQSPNSNIVELEGPSPTSPNLNISSASSTSGLRATLTWEDVPGADSYRLYKNGTQIATNAKSGLDDLTDWNNGLITYYILPVTESNRTGEKSNDVSVDTTMPTPTAPSWRSASYNATSDAYRVYWNSSTFALWYEVRYRINGGSWVSADVGNNLTWLGSVASGEQIQVEVRAGNYSGVSNWGATRTYTPVIDKPVQTYSPQYTSYYKVHVPISCTNSDLVSKVRHDASGSMSSWSGERTGSSANNATYYTGIYGHATTVEWQFWCKSNGKYSAVVNLTTQNNPRPVPAPSGGMFHTSDPVWDYYENMARQNVHATYQTGCRSGTSLQWRYKHSSTPYVGYESWSGWMSSVNSQQTAAYSSRNHWNYSNYMMIEARCASNANPSVTSNAVPAYSGGSQTQVIGMKIPAPTGVWMEHTYYNTVNWGANCPNGTWKEYTFTNPGGRLYYVTTAPYFPYSTAGLDPARSTLEAVCKSNYNNSPGPSVTVKAIGY